MYHKPKLHEIIINAKNSKDAKSAIQKELKKDRKNKLQAIDADTGNTILHTAVIVAGKTNDMTVLKYLLTEVTANGLTTLIHQQNSAGQSVLDVAKTKQATKNLFAEFLPAGTAEKTGNSAQALAQFSAQQCTLFALMEPRQRHQIISNAVFAAVKMGSLVNLNIIFAEVNNAVGKPGDFIYSDGLLALWHALSLKNSEIIRYLVESAALANLDKRVPPGQNQPIFFAIEAVDIELVHLLIQRGVQINCRANSGITPLHHAASKGDLAVFKALISAGADLNARAQGEYYAGETPLHFLIEHNHSDLVVYLLTEHQGNIQLNLAGKQRITPLDAAACLGHEAICAMLIAAGATVNNKRFLVILSKLIYEKKYGTLNLLLTHLAIIADKNWVMSHLHVWLRQMLFAPEDDIATAANATAITEFLQQYGNKRLQNLLNFLLYQIAWEGDLEKFKQLVTIGASIKTPFLLEAAIHAENFQLVDYIIAMYPDSMTNHKIDPGALAEEFYYEFADIAEYSLPLYAAVANNNAQVVSRLIAQGGDIHYKLPEGETLLHCAIENGYFAVAKILLDAGVAVNAQASSNGCAAIHLAIECAKTSASVASITDDANSIAAEKIADEEAISDVTDSAAALEFLQYLIEVGKADINLSLVGGATPLFLAVEQQNVAIVTLLCGQQNINVDAEANCEEAEANFLCLTNPPKQFKATALCQAAYFGNAAICELLLNAGANVNYSIIDGRGPLSIALDRGHESTALLLITRQAKVNQVDCEGPTPLYSAFDADFPQATLALIAQGAKLQPTEEQNALSEIEYIKYLINLAQNQHKTKVLAALESLLKEKCPEPLPATPAESLPPRNSRRQEQQINHQNLQDKAKNSVALLGHGHFKRTNIQPAPSTLTWGGGKISKQALAQYAAIQKLPWQVAGKGGERYLCYIAPEIAAQITNDPLFARAVVYIQMAAGKLGQNGFKDLKIAYKMAYALDSSVAQQCSLTFALKWPGQARYLCFVLSPDSQSSTTESQSLIVLAVPSKHGVGHGRKFVAPTRTLELTSPDRWLQLNSVQNAAITGLAPQLSQIT